MELKQHIESLYIEALYYDEAPNVFASKILEAIGEDKSKETRTDEQNRARWRYLSLVANILNDRGITYDAPGLDVPIKWNKDILYHIYWQTSRSVLFPSKKRQLNTKEFTQLTDHIKDLFAMVFDVHIPFPNIKDKLLEDEAKKMQGYRKSH